MILFRRYRFVLPAFLYLAAFAGCTKVWDDHNQITDSNLKNNLYEAIKQNTSLGKFSDMLAKTGYDKIISSSKTYTVWAPTDQALQTLDPAILNDTARLKLFVGNHIANQSYLEGGATGTLRVQVLNGKYITITAASFDSAHIVAPNQYANNGVFHTIDKFIPRYDNCWEFVKNTTAVPLMKSFLSSLDTLIRDPSKAVQIGVDPSTGQPVYQPGTGYVPHNKFLDSVVDVSDESGQYTLVLLTDNAYTTESAKITPWFATGTADSTNYLSRFHLVKDLAFKGMYTLAQLPDTLVSNYGVKTPMVKSAIVATYKTSNGIVYIMNQVNFTKENKFPSIYIQGENPSRFQADRNNNTFYRVRYNPLTGKDFNDILMTDYNFANYFIAYFRKGLNSMRYNAYWVAVNDVQPALYQQRFGYGVIRNDTAFVSNFAPQTVAWSNYNEVYLGQFSFSSYTNQYFFVTGPNVATSKGTTDVISLDYIRLEPAF